MQPTESHMASSIRLYCVLLQSLWPAACGSMRWAPCMPHGLALETLSCPEPWATPGAAAGLQGSFIMLKEACLVAFVVVDVGKRVLNDRRKKRASGCPSSSLQSLVAPTVERRHPACLQQGGRRRCWCSSERSRRRWPLHLPAPSRPWPPLPCCGSRRCLTWASRPC